MKLELTQRQAEALAHALNVFECSYEGWDDEEIGADTKQDLKCIEKVYVKLEALLGWED